MRLIYPSYIYIVEKKSSNWYFREPAKIFYRSPDCKLPLGQKSRAENYGLSDRKIIIELFRKYLGKLGFYVVNMRDRKYYYCGLTWQDVQEKLWEIGITKRG